MKLFFKKISIYLLLFLLFLSMILYSVTSTHIGNTYLSYHLSNYLSTKSKHRIDIYYLNFENYPTIDIKMRVNRVDESILKVDNHPIQIKADVFTKIEYNISDKIIYFDMKFREMKFFKTELTDKLSEKVGINLLKGLYDKSSFIGTYQNSLLSALLKIDNGREHIHLKKININFKTNHVYSKFEIDIQNRVAFGKIDGTIDNPKVSVDISRTLMRTMGKGFGGFFF